jgi:hypothetical protein
MLITDDEKRLVEQLEAAGWRSRDVNGTLIWTLRGFEGSSTTIEAHGHICAGWAAQRLADLVKPWYLDRSVWLTVLAASGGVTTAVVNELVGSQNAILSAAGMALATLAPFIGKYIHTQAQAAAALDMRKPEGLLSPAQPPK